MQKKSEDFSMQEALKKAKSPEGQKILEQLKGMDGKKLRQIADLASGGDMDSAQKMLQTLLQQGDRRQ